MTSYFSNIVIALFKIVIFQVNFTFCLQMTFAIYFYPVLRSPLLFVTKFNKSQHNPGFPGVCSLSKGTTNFRLCSANTSFNKPVPAVDTAPPHDPDLTRNVKSLPNM